MMYPFESGATLRILHINVYKMKGISIQFYSKHKQAVKHGFSKYAMSHISGNSPAGWIDVFLVDVKLRESKMLIGRAIQFYLSHIRSCDASAVFLDCFKDIVDKRIWRANKRFCEGNEIPLYRST